MTIDNLLYIVLSLQGQLCWYSHFRKITYMLLEISLSSELVETDYSQSVHFFFSSLALLSREDHLLKPDKSD